MTKNARSAANEQTVYEYSIDSDESASTAVLLFVGDVVDSPIEDLPPLTSIVNTEHLDGLCASFADENGQVSFTYYGFDVTISVDETVVLRPIDG